MLLSIRFPYEIEVTKGIRRKEKDIDRSSSVEQISIRRGIMKFHPVQRSERINPSIMIVSNFFHLVVRNVTLFCFRDHSFVTIQWNESLTKVSFPANCTTVTLKVSNE